MANMDFANEVVAELQAWGITASAKEVVKNNDTVLTGIMVGEGNINPTVYIDQMIEDGLNIEEIADRVASVAEQNAPQFSLKDIVEIVNKFEVAKGMIRARLCNLKANEEMLKSIPYKKVLGDLAVYAVIELPANVADGMGTVKVNDQILENWDQTAEEVIDLAIQQSNQEATEMPFPIDFMVAPFKIVTNQRQIGGAVSILNEEFMEKFGDDIFVIPSSVHECLVIPNDGATVASEIDAMIRDVNSNCVSPEEVLSDHAYRFVNGAYVA